MPIQLSKVDLIRMNQDISGKSRVNDYLCILAFLFGNNLFFGSILCLEIIRTHVMNYKIQN